MTNILDKKLGIAIKDARTKHNLTQQDVADRLGVTRSAYGNWEQGTRQISMRDLIRVCDILDEDVNDVIASIRKYAYKK